MYGIVFLSFPPDLGDQHLVYCLPSLGFIWACLNKHVYWISSIDYDYSFSVRQFERALRKQTYFTGFVPPPINCLDFQYLFLSTDIFCTKTKGISMHWRKHFIRWICINECSLGMWSEHKTIFLVYNCIKSHTRYIYTL